MATRRFVLISVAVGVLTGAAALTAYLVARQPVAAGPVLVEAPQVDSIVPTQAAATRIFQAMERTPYEVWLGSEPPNGPDAQAMVYVDRFPPSQRDVFGALDAYAAAYRYRYHVLITFVGGRRRGGEMPTEAYGWYPMEGHLSRLRGSLHEHDDHSLGESACDGVVNDVTPDRMDRIARGVIDPPAFQRPPVIPPTHRLDRPVFDSFRDQRPLTVTRTARRAGVHDTFYLIRLERPVSERDAFRVLDTIDRILPGEQHAVHFVPEEGDEGVFYTWEPGAGSLFRGKVGRVGDSWSALGGTHEHAEDVTPALVSRIASGNAGVPRFTPMR